MSYIHAGDFTYIPPSWPPYPWNPIHTQPSPGVKRIEYHPNGTIKEIEYFEPPQYYDTEPLKVTCDGSSANTPTA